MRKRRALSTVVGMAFAIIALMTTVTYITYSMNVLNGYNQSVLVKNQQMQDVSKEKFQISNVLVSGSKLNMTVANTGTLPITLTKIWVQNTSATATDWTHSYVPSNSFVVPGGTLSNIGQNIPLSIKSTNSYNIKLVTSRGNAQQVAMNSAGSVPLNIQMMFLPPTVSSGFTSELMMVVINNSTGTLTNITPSSLPSPTYGAGNSGNLVCTAGSINPPKYNTLAPGNAAIFTWVITTSAGNGGDTCTYNLSQPLQNGFLQTVSPPTPLTISLVSLSSTTYALNAGVVTASYTTFLWTEGNTWNKDWSVPSTSDVAFSVQLINNNQTAGGYTLWLDQNSQLMLFPVSGGNGKNTPYLFCIVNSVQLPSFDITRYSPNYNVGIPNQGGAGTIYFGAYGSGNGANCAGTGGTGPLPPGVYTGTLVMYGKFAIRSNDNTGGLYAQQIPVFAVKSN